VIALAAIIGGAAFWLRGSALFEQWTGRGATSARFTWGAVLALVAVCGGLWWPLAPAVVLAAWLGCIPGWWGSLKLEGVQQYAMHALRGFVWVLPLAILFEVAGAHGAVVLLSGAACVPAYWLGWRLLPSRATEIGEALFGAAVAAAVWSAA
jgi:hypothetical protein